jgi:FkbM family methyltransferase
MTRILRALLSRVRSLPGKRSFSQCGEDLIVDYVLKQMGINLPSYLDVGAYDPVGLSNTYLFYARGARGVCLEPNPKLYAKLASKRKRDTCINAGIGPETVENAPFFVMEPDTLSTFSREVAERYEAEEGCAIRETLSVPTYRLNDILARHFSGRPNFVSLDTEGTEYHILERFDFSAFRPQVFVIETLTYTVERVTTKETAIRDLMGDNGYFLYADTWINSIFVDKHSFTTMG